MNISPLLPRGFFPILSPELCQTITPFEWIEALAEAEISVCILREPKWPREKIALFLQEIQIVAEAADISVIVHNDVPLAQEYQALGVHLNTKSLSISETRQKMPEDFLIGYSAHSLEEAVKAEREGANYLFLGSIYPSPKSHANHPILGTEPLAQIVSQIRIPIYAIGGINDTNLHTVRGTGARGFSALRAVYEHDNPEHQILKWRILWEEA